MARCLSSSSALCAGLQSTLTTFFAPCTTCERRGGVTRSGAGAAGRGTGGGAGRTRLRELQPPEVSVRQTSLSQMLRTFMSGAGSSQDWL